MNYVCAVYAAVVLVMLTDWYARGRKEFHGCREVQDRVYYE